MLHHIHADRDMLAEAEVYCMSSAVGMSVPEGDNVIRSLNDLFVADQRGSSAIGLIIRQKFPDREIQLLSGETCEGIDPIRAAGDELSTIVRNMADDIIHIHKIRNLPAADNGNTHIAPFFAFFLIIAQNFLKRNIFSKIFTDRFCKNFLLLHKSSPERAIPCDIFTGTRETVVVGIVPAENRKEGYG